MIDPLTKLNQRIAALKSGPLSEFSDEKIREFLRFHDANPQVFEAFRFFAKQAHEAGAKRIGARLIAERVRWETQIERRGAYKLNDHHTPLYARMLVAKFPQLEGLFEFRESKWRRAA